MKWVDVPQWVRASAQVPPDDRLASTSVAHSTCPPSHGSTELEGARRQAAGRRPEMRIVVDSRISLKAVQRGTPTVSSGRKAAVPDALWRVEGTPPGSKSGAGIHGGSSGTWESPRSPCHIPGMGDRATKSPGVLGERRSEHEPARDTPNGQKQARYRGASDKRSAARGAAGQSSRRLVPEQVGKCSPKTHWREGDAGHHVELDRATGETLRSPTVPPHSSALRRKPPALPSGCLRPARISSTQTFCARLPVKRARPVRRASMG
jgi:hypothetical protein